jgi:ketosteroid isomerase-like protein
MKSKSTSGLDQRIEALEARLRALEDVQALIRLKADYCNFNDGGWSAQGPTHMGPAADDFTEDGIWDGRPFAPRVEGREAIRDMLRDYRAVPFVIHYVMNPKIEVKGDTATAHWHLLAPLTSPDGSHRWAMGTYEESYLRTARGWKCKMLRYVTARVASRPGGWGDPID